MPGSNEGERMVPASNFVGTVAANVDNRKLSDAEFRQFIRDTLPIVIYDRCEKEQQLTEICRKDSLNESYVDLFYLLKRIN